jgi:hypothetical protein
MVSHTTLTRWRALQLAREILPDDAPSADVYALASKLLNEVPHTLGGYG